jgi:hypothetical protein
MCAAPSSLPNEIPPVIPTPQSGGPEPTPPTPPALPTPAVQSPVQTPAPPTLPPALVQATAMGWLAPAAPEPIAPTAMQVQPVTPMSLLLLPPRPATPPRFLIRNAAAWPVDPARAVQRPHASARSSHRGQPDARWLAPLTSFGFRPPSSGGGVASGGGGAGTGVGVTTALAIWILLALPGVAVLRLPASRRGPRAHVDDTRTRPG